MLTTLDQGKAVRLTRLSRRGDGRFLVIPLDHSVSDGPVATTQGLRDLVTTIAENGADAIVLHKGRIGAIPPETFRNTALIVHLSASTGLALDGNAKVLVGSVEDAVRAGADAVSVHVNIGCETEPRQLADLGAVAAACRDYGMPLLAMMYARGPRITDPHAVDVVSRVVNVAADLGADLVKTVRTRDPEDMRTVVESCPIPVLVAGGARQEESFADAATALKAGCVGLAVGRRVFEAEDPGAVVRELVALVH
jgi:2-amino-4,5-dihydroxy-6-oxo-7-(phosphonooxy)heptanoate synthase